MYTKIRNITLRWSSFNFKKHDAALYKVIYFFELSNVVDHPDVINKTLETIKFLLDHNADTRYVKKDINYLMKSIKKLKKIYHGDDLKDMLEKEKVYLQILDMIK